MSLADVDAFPSLAADAVGAAMSALGSGQRLVLVGADRRGVMDVLRADAGLARPILMLAPADARGASAVIGCLLDDLAELALARLAGAG